MKILVKRTDFTRNSTVGEMFIDGVFCFYTLEDDDKLSRGEQKVQGETAIPKGTYKVMINMSTRFKKMMPLLIGVPNFEGVRIHNGNTKADSSGCILVGLTKSTDFVGNSRSAFDMLMKKLDKATDGITITIQ